MDKKVGVVGMVVGGVGLIIATLLMLKMVAPVDLQKKLGLAQ